MKHTNVTAALALAFSAATGPLQAQETDHCATRSATRAALERCIAQLDSLAQTPTGEAVRRDLEVARRRLAEGDFQIGDLIILTVAGESTLTDTFMVQPNRTLPLPGIGQVSMAGVLRGELLPHLSGELGRYLRNPMVEARTLLRLSVTGEVERPGFYPVPAEAVLADVVMSAGGLTQEAKANGLEIMRGKAKLWTSEQLQVALEQGRTVDELDLRDGDRIVVPRRGGISFDRVLMLALALPTAIIAITQLTGGESTTGR